MSEIQELRNDHARSMEERGKAQDESQRFTPLRSYVSRARVRARGPRGEPLLSRLIPRPRLQS